LRFLRRDSGNKSSPKAERDSEEKWGEGRMRTMEGGRVEESWRGEDEDHGGR
jgi:hypothetical protein